MATQEPLETPPLTQRPDKFCLPLLLIVEYTSPYMGKSFRPIPL
ncbi:hypothetical protein [Halalkalibacter hemicellulosilyticus]